MYILRKMILMLITVVGGLIPALILFCINFSPAGDSHSFPLRVGESEIVMEKLQKYDGTYFEDRSGEYVEGIAAGIFVNTGSQCVESAYIEVFVPDNKYTFEICMLPPGMRVFVLDTHKTKFSVDCPVDYSINCKMIAQSIEYKIKIQSINDSVQLINHENHSISFSVYHRLWNKREQMYYGGVAYKTYVKDFGPSDRIWLKPGFTFPYDSKIVYIIKEPVCFSDRLN